MKIEVDDKLIECIRGKILWDSRFIDIFHLKPDTQVTDEDLTKAVNQAVEVAVHEWMGDRLVKTICQPIWFENKELKAIMDVVQENMKSYCNQFDPFVLHYVGEQNKKSEDEENKD